MLTGSYSHSPPLTQSETMVGLGPSLPLLPQSQHPGKLCGPTGHRNEAHRRRNCRFPPSWRKSGRRWSPSSHVASRREARNTELPPGSGSGIILDAGGYILTNNHLVQGVTSVVVGLSTGRLTPGRVVARDFLLDLALVRITAPDLVPAEFSRTDDLRDRRNRHRHRQSPRLKGRLDRHGRRDQRTRSLGPHAGR